jgi:hypothetical protein
VKKDDHVHGVIKTKPLDTSAQVRVDGAALAWRTAPLSMVNITSRPLFDERGQKRTEPAQDKARDAEDIDLDS